MRLRIARHRRLDRCPTIRPPIRSGGTHTGKKKGGPAGTGAAPGPHHQSHRKVRKGLLSHVHDTAPPSGSRTPT